MNFDVYNLLLIDEKGFYIWIFSSAADDVDVDKSSSSQNDVWRHLVTSVYDSDAIDNWSWIFRLATLLFETSIHEKPRTWDTHLQNQALHFLISHKLITSVGQAARLHIVDCSQALIIKRGLRGSRRISLQHRNASRVVLRKLRMLQRTNSMEDFTSIQNLTNSFTTMQEKYDF